MSEIKRRRNEPFEAYMRRVKQQWQRSGKMIQARKVQYFEPKKSKNVKKMQAVTRAKFISKTDYLKKTGRLPQIDEKNKRKK